MIGADGSQLGIMTFQRGLDLAKQAGFDLALVADQATPPVCRIVNFGKLIYEQKKKDKEQRKLQHQHKVKEIKFGCNIDPHDYQIKMSHAIEFLQKGYKLKASMMFKGREMAHKELGFGIMQKVIKELEGQGVAENTPKLIGRSIIININPAHH